MNRPGDVNAPAGTGLAADRRAIGPIDPLANREGAGAGGVGRVPDVQHAFAAADRFQNQPLAGLKIVAGHQPAVPLQDFDPSAARPRRPDTATSAAALARLTPDRTEIDQPHVQLRIASARRR